jgi:hypothetical protein
LVREIIARAAGSVLLGAVGFFCGVLVIGKFCPG